jgi:DnaK suppressor protein
MARDAISAERRQQLRELLHRLREQTVQDVETQIGRRLSDAGERAVEVVMDMEDLASKDLGDGVDYALLQMRYRTYKDIAEAFRRFEEGTYGVCEGCGTHIPLPRLQAEPFARLCVSCQEKTEAVDQVEREEQRFKTAYTKPRRR